MTKNYVLKPIYNDENECINDTLSLILKGSRTRLKATYPQHYYSLNYLRKACKERYVNLKKIKQLLNNLT